MNSSLVILVALVGAFVAVQGATPKFGIEMVNFINSQADKTFTATQYSRFENLTLDGLKKFLSNVNTAPDLSKLSPSELVDSSKTDKVAAAPASFDSATKWTACKGVINGIQDQSSCGNCWAVSAAEVMTDRRCIAYNSPKPRISAWDITTCCKACMTGDGCGGGWPDIAFKWFVSTGVVTGDKFGGPGCQPYQVNPATGKLTASSSKCVMTCKPTYKAFTYPKDKHHGTAVKVFSNNNAAVMAEIMARGPVVATFAVYEDFPGYRSGIYKHRSGALAGYHAVKITGWGVANGVPYWKVANQWGSSWGEGGFFRIVRGGNDCGFEGGISTAVAKKD